MKENKVEDKDIDLSKQMSKSRHISKASIGLWLLEHKRHMILLVIIVLAISSLLLYSFFFYNLFDYLRYGKEHRKAIDDLLSANINVSTHRTALPIESLENNFFAHDGFYDFIAKIKNPNNNFFARVSYCFVAEQVVGQSEGGQTEEQIGGQRELACAENIIFPEEEKYLLIISKKIEERPKKVEFKIKNVVWERVDVRKYLNWSDYYNLRANFEIRDIKFEKEIDSTTKKSFNNLNFSIENKSPYNYWEVPLQIILFNRGSVVGINTYKITEFRSRELREIKMSWANSVSNVNEVKIHLNLNVLDESNYISYK